MSIDLIDSLDASLSTLDKRLVTVKKRKSK